MPLVSVIIPFYNSEEFLENAIKSVLNQSFQDWEMILCNDGAKDNSYSIAQKYVSSNPEKIKIVEHPGQVNLGTSATRNLGLKFATGEYVHFLDSDDFIMEHFYEKHVEHLLKHPGAAFSVSQVLRWHEWDIATANIKFDFIQNLYLENVESLGNLEILALYLKNEGLVPMPSTVLYRKQYVNAVDGWENAFRGLYDDQVLLAKLLINNMKPIFLAECLCKYRQHKNSLCGSNSDLKSYFNYRTVFLAWMFDYVQSGNFNYSNLNKLIKSNQRDNTLYRTLFVLVGSKYKYFIAIRLRIEKLFAVRRNKSKLYK